MRQIKKPVRIMLIVCIAVIAIIGYLSYMFNVKRNYPLIREMYNVCHERVEKIHALMLPYVESNGLDLEWYAIHSNKTPWQEEAFVLLKELEADYIEVCESGYITSNAIGFHKRDTGKWCMSIYVQSGYGRQVNLHYYPYNELPFSYSEQLEGLADGWSFTAERNY